MKRSKSTKSVDVLAPKPVHPRAMQTHGLFGIPYVRQHMVIDELWTPNSINEEFQGMTHLLSKRLHCKKLDHLAHQKATLNEHRMLRTDCRDGQNKLQMTLVGANSKCIRNYLINHRDLQRLYQHLPIRMVVDNINQRTFVMRKERDRLRYRLNQLKQKYYERLVERAMLENLIKYEDSFVLDEEVKAWDFRKRIENSNTRLRAIKTINGTYKKMIQVLQQDSLFYEPILKSLDDDIEDQAKFIKHILYLGMPAIGRFKELNEEYRLFEERTHRELQFKLQWLAQCKKEESKRLSQPLSKHKPEDAIALMKRYVRETDSMNSLKTSLEAIENTIKEVKFATLCSQAKEIFPRIKSQTENNVKLMKKIEEDVLGHETLEIKNKRSEVLEDVLINNLSDEEKARLEKINKLKEEIVEEDQKEAEILEYLKRRADLFVILRLSLWNLNDILRHVDQSPKLPQLDYPESYLNLPLLKFDLLTMRAVVPETYQSNADELMKSVKRKVIKLMGAFVGELKPMELQKNNDDYHILFLNNLDVEDFIEEAGPKPADDEELMADAKLMQGIPNRKQIKAQSAKVVEECAKKAEE